MDWGTGEELPLFMWQRVMKRGVREQALEIFHDTEPPARPQAIPAPESQIQLPEIDLKIIKNIHFDFALKRVSPDFKIFLFQIIY